LRMCEEGIANSTVLRHQERGKTSLLEAFLNESDYPYVYLNARRLADYGYSVAGLYGALSEELSKIRERLAQLLDYLKSIRGLLRS